MSQASIGDLQFRIVSPEKMTATQWTDVQYLRRAAYTAALPGRTQAEIEYLTQWEDTTDFSASCIDPQLAVRQGRLAPHQEFSEFRAQRVVTVRAQEGSEILGFAYTAEKIPGKSALTRRLKTHVPQLRHAWLREVVVLPEHQGQGIDNALGALALDWFDDRQPVRATTLVGDDPAFNSMRALGLTPTAGKQLVYPFGETAEPTKLLSWSGATIARAYQSAAEVLAGGTAAIDNAAKIAQRY